MKASVLLMLNCGDFLRNWVSAHATIIFSPHLRCIAADSVAGDKYLPAKMTSSQSPRYVSEKNPEQIRLSASLKPVFIS